MYISYYLISYFNGNVVYPSLFYHPPYGVEITPYTIKLSKTLGFSDLGGFLQVTIEMNNKTYILP